MGGIIVTCVKNPFDHTKREIRRMEFGPSVGDLLQEFYPDGAEGYDIVVAVDGTTIDIPDPRVFVPDEGTSVAFCLVPQGGGAGKTVLKVVAMIVVVILSVYSGGAAGAAYAGATGTAATGIGAVTAGAIASSAVMIAGGMLVNAVFPTTLPDSAMGNYATSPTYSWAPGSNALYEGGTLPELFGTHRVIPPLISKFIETDGAKQYLNLLYAVAGHKIDRITDVRINGVDSNNFVGVLIDTRLGKIHQTAIPFFGDSRFDNPVGAKLQDPVTAVISSVYGNSSSLTVITTTDHGFFEGQYVDIAGVEGMTNVNGYSYRIGNVTANTFDIFNSDNEIQNFSGTYAGGGTATNGWIVRTTSGDVLSGFGVGIVFPRGLYFASDSGSLKPQTVKIYIEYRETGTNDPWVRVQGYNTVELEVFVDRWSMGHWTGGGGESGTEGQYWEEVSPGSTVFADHAEGDPAGEGIWMQPDTDVGTGYMWYYETWHWVTVGVIKSVGDVVREWVEVTGAQIEPLRPGLFKKMVDNPRQFDIRMRLAEVLPSGSRYGNEVQFEFIQEITSGAFEFPGTALLAVRALATDQLSGGLPTVDCLAARDTVPVLVANKITLASSELLEFGGLANENPLSGWSTCSGNGTYYPLQIYNGVICGTVENEYNMMVRDGSFPDDQASSVTVFIKGGPENLDIGAGVRMQRESTSDGYVMELWYDSPGLAGIGIYQSVNGDWNELAYKTIPLPVKGDVFTLVASGFELTVLKNQELEILKATDALYTSGQPAILVYPYVLPSIDLVTDVFGINGIAEYWTNALYVENPVYPGDSSAYIFICWSPSSYGHPDGSQSNKPWSLDAFYESIVRALVTQDPYDYDRLFAGDPTGKNVWFDVPAGTWEVSHVPGVSISIRRTDGVRSKLFAARMSYRDGNRGAPIFDNRYIVAKNYIIPLDTCGISAWDSSVPTVGAGYALKPASNPAWAAYHLLHRATWIDGAGGVVQ